MHSMPERAASSAVVATFGCVWVPFALAGLAGCHCSGSVEGPPPCESADPPPGCGVDCSDAAVSCDLGFYCGNSGSCTADCTYGGDVTGCAAGEICSNQGRCVPGTGESDSRVCADVTLTTMPTTPTVMVLVDQSGSMTDPFDYATKWIVLRDTLTDPATGLFYQLENVVRFGLALYTGIVGEPVCPTVTVVPPALMNATAIDGVYSGQDPLNDTPTGESISAITFDTVAGGFDFVGYAEPGPKIIIVATDGEPDTCAVPNPQNGQPEAIAAAMASHGAGIDLYMIGVGLNSVSAGHLQDMANAGVGLPVCGGTCAPPGVNAPYYEVGTQADLIAALSGIVGGVISCTLDLNGMISTAGASSGQVRLDGMPLGFGDPDGWDVVDSDTIILNGAACATLSDGGTHTVDATFPCDVIL